MTTYGIDTDLPCMVCEHSHVGTYTVYTMVLPKLNEYRVTVHICSNGGGVIYYFDGLCMGHTKCCDGCAIDWVSDMFDQQVLNMSRITEHKEQLTKLTNISQLLDRVQLLDDTPDEYDWGQHCETIKEYRMFVHYTNELCCHPPRVDQ
jgi:hypothetical protein